MILGSRLNAGFDADTPRATCAFVARTDFAGFLAGGRATFTLFLPLRPAGLAERPAVFTEVLFIITI
jgi:hypothetical protein